jgi:hypothetical protein
MTGTASLERRQGRFYRPIALHGRECLSPYPALREITEKKISISPFNIEYSYRHYAIIETAPAWNAVVWRLNFDPDGLPPSPIRMFLFREL